LNANDTTKLEKQNEIIISLLGRIAFKKVEVKDIVTFKKQNPDKYVDGFNACDGTRSLSDIAKVVGVSKGTLSPILSEWEDLGIIFEVERPERGQKGAGKFYRRIFPI
jgi:hypothetical protein